MSKALSWKRVTAAEVHGLLTDQRLLLLDVRDPTTYSAEHINGAMHLSQANLESVLRSTPKDRPLLIYCYHGNASQTYAEMFRDFGFTAVHDLIGGYEAWRTAAAPGPMLSAGLRSWLQAQGFPPEAIETPIANGMTPLMRACRFAEIAIVDELLALGVALTPCNSDGNNALWLACFSGNHDIIARLIDRGIDIDHQNDNGASCLMYAASSGKDRVVAQLLAAGANPQLKSADDYTALDMAATEECLRLLRQFSVSRPVAVQALRLTRAP